MAESASDVRIVPRTAGFGVVAAAVAVGIVTTIASLAFGVGQLPDVVMLYLLGVVLVSLRWGLLPSLLASFLSVASFDYFFVPPFHTFAVTDARHVVTFTVMFLVGVIISGLTKRVRDQAQAAHERELRVAREVLKNSLLSSVSHDLRTPLAVITGAASTMREGKIDERTRGELVETVLTQSERLNRLVQNLLDVTRVEAGAIALQKEWQPLEEVVGAALERTSATLGSRPVRASVPADLHAPVDAVLLEQLLVNLLENAAKYTPADALVEVTAGRDGEAALLVVADRGPGLPAGDEERVFEKLYRAERGKGGGVGLGLTICKGIAEAHGGTIRAENREGAGASFVVRLPLEGEPPSVAPTEGASP